MKSTTLTPQELERRKFAVCDLTREVYRIEQTPCRNVRFIVESGSVWPERLRYFAYRAHRKLHAHTRGRHLVLAVGR